MVTDDIKIQMMKTRCRYHGDVNKENVKVQNEMSFSL